MASKSRKRQASAKEQTSTLFYLWHNLRDIKAEAQRMDDGELVLLLEMTELLLEERICGLNIAPAAMAAAADTALPN